MSIKTILTEPNKILRQVSKPVEKVGQETITTNLSSTGTYQMEIYDWNNADDTANAGNYCFDVQISN